MRLLAIDGNSILNRAFYGIKMLSNKKGVFTNALTGFMNIYLKAIEDEKPDAVAVAFDMKAKTFRHLKVLSYKATRKDMPPELVQQFLLIKEILTYMGIRIIETEGFEADDVLGTLSRIATENNNSCVILTGDRDNLQLIDDCVSVRLCTNKEQIVFTPEKFSESYDGLKPLQLIDLKALMGDSSDNIKGVAGIGEKTAMSLIKEYHSVEELYENIETAELTNTVKTKLINGKSDAEESKWLATIVKNAPVSENINDYIPKQKNAVKLNEILTDLEMFRLKEKLLADTENTSTGNIKLELTTDAEIIPLDEKNLSLLKSLKELSFIFKEKNIQITDNKNIYFSDNEKFIKDFLLSETLKITFDAKPCFIYAFKNGFTPVNIKSDAMIAAYLLSSSTSEYTIKRLCEEYHTGYFTSLNEYADIFSLKILSEKLLSELHDTDMEKLFYEIEQPLTEVLASMEYHGILINKEGVTTFGEQIKLDMKGLEEQIYFYAGKEFNIGSPKQLGVVLFEDLGLPSKKKTKTGYSTNADVLEELRGKHPIIENIINYRHLSKLSSTYVDGLLKVVGDDGRIHSNFKQTETRTGRISSTEPNMQNIPVRTELGRNMRKFFVAKDGYILLDADYSQIELRILAAVCGDEHMQNAFNSGQDIHTTTASQVFNMPIPMVTGSMRRAAKAVNFGIIYGIGAFSLSKDIDVSVKQAKEYIENYLANYPKVAEFMNKTVNDAIKNGYVTTMFKRRRYIPEISSSNKIMQAFGKRAAMNAPIQGSAADIIKIAMIRVYRRLKEENLDARLLLQVHDELIVESSLKDADKAAIVLNEEMENAVSISVPLTADVERGKSWYDAKG